MFATLTGALPRRTLDGVDLAALELGAAQGLLDPADLAAAADALVRELVVEQEAAGLEPVTDGQVRVADLGAAVAGALGVTAEPGAPPARWTGPILMDAWRFAAGVTSRAVKQALPGPYTLGRRFAADRRGERTLALADALAHELAALAAAGCPLVEVEEPAACEIGVDERERALFVDAQRRLLVGAGGTHASLAVVGGDASAAAPETFFATGYASFLFDLIAGPDDWRLITRAPGERGIVCGALDARDDADDDPALLVWAAHYAASTRGRGLARVGLSTSSSLGHLSRERAGRKMRALGEAARIAAAGSVEEIAAALDPRAIDRRTAALGGVRPGVRSPRGGRRTRPDR